MVDFAKINALAEQAVKDGVDMTQAKAGGGDYTPPPEGPCNLRFVSYIEIGKHEKKMKGIPKTTDRVLLTFEVSGKRYPAVKNETTGEMVPIRISIEENLSLNEKANFFKLFTRMNYAGKAKHMAQLLGGAYRGEIVHDKWTGSDGKERVTAQLRNEAGYTITAPRVPDEDSETGYRMVEVAAPITPLKAFLWNYADKADWDALYIDGQYPERTDKDGKVIAPAKSKNVLQNRIKLAKNFVGSPVHQLLVAGGAPIDIPSAEDARGEGEHEDRDVTADIPDTPASTTPTGAAATDALNGIVG